VAYFPGLRDQLRHSRRDVVHSLPSILKRYKMLPAN
jgi:hypothetical protein